MKSLEYWMSCLSKAEIPLIQGVQTKKFVMGLKSETRQSDSTCMSLGNHGSCAPDRSPL